MAKRPQKRPPDCFTAAEIAVGSDISERNVEFLVSRDIAPPPFVKGTRGGGPTLWNSEGLAEWAPIGALHKAGVELTMAASLSRALIDDFASPRGFLPTGLFQNYIRGNKNPDGQFPFETGGDENIRLSDDFWLHHFLRTRSSIYQPYIALDEDWVIEIADRKYVFTSVPSLAGKVQNTGAFKAIKYPIEPHYEISGWERGASATIKWFCDDLNYRIEEDQKKIEEREIQWCKARQNAVGVLIINASLAIRNALDAIHDHRLTNEIELDWTATIKPPSGRYDGCDANGRPLDPEHPWNRDLPPLERAKRLLEIEEYIAARDAKKETDTS